LELLDERSPFVHFSLAAYRWDVVDLLPSHSAIRRRGQGWTGQVYFAALPRTAASMQRLVWLAETRGFDLDTTGPAADLPQPHRNGPRGMLLAPLYGVPSHMPDLNQLRPLAMHLAPASARSSTPYEALVLDERNHAVLRSRIALNRAAFNGVRIGGRLRSDRPNMSPLCQHCALHPPAEDTALHVIAQCPRFSARRLQLKNQLRAVIDSLRQRCFEDTRLSQAIHDENELFYHVVLVSPATLDLDCVRLHRDARERLLRLTGGFLEFIRSIRPI
jgi:hypothetical protein